MNRLGKSSIYCMFVRNQGGTFQAAGAYLPEIARMGFDVVWLLPIHPTGMAQRKGSLGSPYAIADYRAMDETLGTMEDFTDFVEKAHQLHLKVIMDVVFHHTSPDSVLAKTHPEWFYHKEDGSFGNHVGDWSDIIDLDFEQSALWTELIDTLCMWAKIVDGFRCDVAPLIPLDFWKQARQAVEAVHPGAIWLSESVEKEFLHVLRDLGLPAHSDAEMYEAFDLCYDYDIADVFYGFLEGRYALETYVDAINNQNAIYPADYGKLRFLENHDRPRFAYLVEDARRRNNFLSFLFFMKGTPLVYAGQEAGALHRPSLFGADPIPSQPDPKMVQMIQRLNRIRKESVFGTASYAIQAISHDHVLIRWRGADQDLVGVFALGRQDQVAKVPLGSGTYHNLLDDTDFCVEDGYLSSRYLPVIFWCSNA